MDGFTRSAAPPPLFGVQFLDWFRAITERNWAARQARYYEGTEYAEFGSAPWQQHARWLQGLPDATIDDLERTWSVRFPPDLRLFLSLLHAPDRPAGETWDTSSPVPPMQRPFFKTFDFYNWSLDGERLQEYFDMPLQGLLFDIERNDLWHASWGTKDRSVEARKERLTDLVAGAPRLIPICGHRYLVAKTCYAGNPVLSVVQSDIVPYGVDLYDYFFNEFRGYIRPARRPSVAAEAYVWLREIPFWGEFL